MNIAVVGAGYWGKNLVRNFAEIGHLFGICDQQQALVKKFQEEYKVKEIFSRFEDLLAHPQIQALVIATPAASHYELTKKALLAGKDVLVEKPLALKIEEAEELIQIAESKQRILMVDHILQYHPAINKLKELIHDGVLGKLQYIYSNRLNIGRLRHEENILWSFAPHDISVILSLVKEYPKKVIAFGEAYLQEDLYDTTITDMTFKGRLKAHIFVSWLHPYKEQRLVIIGDRNMAVFDDMEDENKLVLYPHEVKWIDRIPVAARAERQRIEVGKEEPLREVCLHFVDCIEKRKTPKTDGKEALMVLKVLHEAQRSLDEEGKKGNG